MSTVPFVLGLSFAEAASALADAGYQVSGAGSEFSETVPAGQVLRSEPPEESELDPGAVVTVVVSAGPLPPSVPDVLLLPGQRAAELLELAGYRVTSSFETSAEEDGGLVVSQDPPGGSLIAPPATVRLGIGAPPVHPVDPTPPPFVTE